MRFGTWHEAEDEATRLITESLKGVTSRSAKSDILTPWKEEDRKNREVYTASGTADPAVRKGMFRRAWNPRHPHLNSRDGQYPARRIQGAMDGSDDGGGGGGWADDGDA